MVEETQARDWAQLHGRKDGMYKFDNPGSADPAALDADQRAAGDPVRVRAQPLFPPGRPRGAAAALYRPGRVRRGRRQADPDQDRRRRDRPAVARPVLQALHLPEGERGAQQSGDPSVDRPRTARIWRSTPTSTPRTRSGASCSATSASGAPCRSAIDRDEINQILYYGLGIGGNNTVLPQSPLYKPEYRDSWAAYDPEKANALLDEIGLTERSSDGLRLLARRPADGAGRRDRGRGERAVRHPRAGRARPGSSSASRSTPSPRSARCSATGSSPARP